MRSVTLLLLFMASAYGAHSQQKTRTELTGKVTDARTGLPLPGATVLLVDSRNGTATDSAGNYLLRNIPVGHTIIEISYAGYKTLVAHLDMAQSGSHDFMLVPTMLENEGVTVTAVAHATSIRKAPIPITRMSRSELLATASTNIIDALSHQPGINQISSGPAVSKPIIRGLGYNRLVVINDGVRQEGQQWGDEHGIEIDENSVNRVEIVKGPASLIYGSDAIAGVINIITTAPVPVNTIRGNILSGYQTNNRRRSLFASLGGNKKGFNWSAWGDMGTAKDYRDQYDGIVFNSRFNEHNYGGYAGLNRSWGFSHLIISNFNQQLGVIEGARDGSGQFLKPVAGGMEVPATSDDLHASTPMIPYQRIGHFKLISDNSFRAGKGRISMNLGWQENKRKEFGNADDPREKSLYFDLRTFNYSVMYHLPEKKGWTNTIGLNGMAQTNRNKGAEVLIPEYSLLDAGVFVYAQKTIGAATLSGGLRYDHRNLDAKALKEGNNYRFTAFGRNYSNVSSSAGVSYAATKNLVIKLNLASGFRAPGMPELASNGAHEGTNRYEYGDQGLGSERSWQADAGFEVNSEHLLFSVGAFYNSIRHFIFYSRLPGMNGGDSLVDVNGDLIPAFRFNQQNAHLAGIEMVADLHPHPWDWLHFQNTFSMVRGIFEQPVDGERDLPFIPAARLISELRGSLLPKGKLLRELTLHLELDNNFAQRHPFTAFGTETATPGYSLLNAAVSTHIIRRNKILGTIYLNASNLTDVAYQNHMSRLKYTDVNPLTGRQGVFNMGRNFSIKLNIPLQF